MTEIIKTIEETVPPKSEEVKLEEPATETAPTKSEEVKTEEPTIETAPTKSEEVKKICVNIKTYYRKRDDTTVSKTYNQTQYSQKYYEKNKNKIKEYVECDICQCRYQKWNKGHHIDSKKHIKAQEALRDKELKEMIIKNGGKSPLQLFLEQYTFT